MNNKGNLIMLTIKELYELAVEKGMENAVVGISFWDEETQTEYVEEVNKTDVEFGGYYTDGRKKISDAIWLHNHEL